MATATAELLRENLEYLEQLKFSYSNDQDTERVERMQESYNGMLSTCLRKESDIRDTIKELSTAISSKQSELESYGSQDSVEGLMESLRHDIGKTQQRVKDMSREERELNEELEELLLKIKASKEHRLQEQRQTTLAEQRLRHELSLYAHVSRATLDADGDEAVSGAVSDPQGHDIRPFSTTLSDLRSAAGRSALVNELWGLID
uniref:Kinetochore protein Spc24 n=1 Tax=Tetraselmis sp. GSL018 TaxID=582737 RepID=A0A061RLG7_9CHLO|mmetsp:Transcript_26208/g.62335  ORF Transcript_26208/g.62335 Transcript_26208/m.62335 type:complete len:204 (+) Transcript_26208:219-830(+)